MAKRVAVAGALYFALVFAAGFVLGPIRILWGIPRFGERTAELMELPLMLLIANLAARFIIRRLAVPAVTADRLRMGGIALLLLLAAEMTLVLGLRGLTLSEYFASRDPVSGTAYAVTLGLFALMPLIVRRREATGSGSSRT